MKSISRHLSPRGTTGLASICVAAAVISFIGHQSLARLNAERALYQVDIERIREQINTLSQTLDQQRSATARNVALAQIVNGPLRSRVLAEIGEQIPADCAVQTIQFAGAEAQCKVMARCADVTRFMQRCANVNKFSAQTAISFESARTKMKVSHTKLHSACILVNTIGDPTGAGFGWSGDLDATVVLTIDSTSIVPSPDPLVTAN